MKCPCYNCICVPVCKYKTFHGLYFNCSLVQKYIETCDGSAADGESSWARSWIYNALKPNKWSVDDKGNIVIERKYSYHGR